jgi:hypothetical protein
MTIRPKKKTLSDIVCRRGERNGVVELSWSDLILVPIMAVCGCRPISIDCILSVDIIGW